MVIRLFKMIEAEVVRLNAALSKAKDNETDRMLDILKELSKQAVTYDILKSTKIGKTIGSSRFRKHENQAVAEATKSLLKSWKQLAKAGTPRAAEKKESEGKKEEQKTEAMAEAMPSASEDAVPPLESDADILRKKAREKFAEILGNASVAARIEVAMLKRFPYEHDAVLRVDNGLGKAAADRVSGGFKKDYKNKFMFLLSNLKRNKKLAKNVADGFTTPAKLVVMEAIELATAEKAAMHAQHAADAKEAVQSDWAERNEDEINAQAGIKNEEGVEACPECQSMKTVILGQQQTRGCDEPMTVFFKCKECGQRWKNDGTND